MLNLPYGKPTTEVSVKMYSCNDNTKSIGAEGNCTNVKFADVQPKIDSTGRANDLFRRVEARVELADIDYPIAEFALASTGSGDANIVKKDFYVTKNCQYTNSYADDYGNIKGTLTNPRYRLNGDPNARTEVQVTNNRVNNNILVMDSNNTCYDSAEMQSN
jgi:hypothetical protein